MASTVGIANPFEESIKGVRRSRFSFHFNTPRVRRWLLVQLVTLPVDEADVEPNPELTRLAQAQAPRAKGDDYHKLLDNYRNSFLMRSVL
jgi:hypothetical protein